MKLISSREPAMSENVSHPSSPLAAVHVDAVSMGKMQRPTSPGSFQHSDTINSPHIPKPLFESPRCQLDDSELFPIRSGLRKPEERWKYLSRQAGSHRQDGTVLHVSRKNMTPNVLKAGIPPEAAKRVHELHLHFMDDHAVLPEWLDVVSTTFTNLEHLYLGGITNVDSNVDEQDCDNDSLSTSSRLRRLYVLYRLPELKSVDGILVTSSEQILARPSDPKGQRVKRGDWITEPSLMDQFDDEEGECMDDGDSDDFLLPQSASAKSVVEVDITGSVRLVNISESKDECSAGHSVETTGAYYKKELAGTKSPNVVNTPKTAFCSSSDYELESPSSSGACEWSATCGGLSLPYFRDASNSARLKLSFRRGKSRQADVGLKDAEKKDYGKTVTSKRCVVQTFEPITSQPSANEKNVELQANNNEILLSYTPTKVEHSQFYREDSEKMTYKISGISDKVTSSVPKVDLQLTQQALNMPPHKSLTSPFPMQFRARNDKINEGPIFGEKFRRRATMSAPSTSSDESEKWSSLGQLDTIECIVPLTRVMSSPTQLTFTSISPKTNRNGLPPPRPPGARRLAPSLVQMTLMSTYKNRKCFPKWRKQSARSSSILDTSADSDEEDISDEDDIRIP